MVNSKVEAEASGLVFRAQLWGSSIPGRELARPEPGAEAERLVGSSHPSIVPYTQEQYLTLNKGLWTQVTATQREITEAPARAQTCKRTLGSGLQETLNFQVLRAWEASTIYLKSERTVAYGALERRNQSWSWQSDYPVLRVILPRVLLWKRCDWYSRCVQLIHQLINY